MRAARIEAFGPVGSHQFGELPDPKPGPGEVLIDVHAIGVNFPDSLMVQGLYQVKPEHPFSPGRDAAGVVTEIGDGVTNVKVGDRVVTVAGQAVDACADEKMRANRLAGTTVLDSLSYRY